MRLLSAKSQGQVLIISDERNRLNSMVTVVLISFTPPPPSPKPAPEALYAQIPCDCPDWPAA